MHIRTRVAAGALAALTVAGCAAGTAAAQATPQATGQLTFDSQLTAIQFFTASGPITGFPTAPLVPGDRIIGQDRILQNGSPAGHDIVILTGQGDLQVGWTLQWPASGTPATFDGVIDGGTANFAAAHGTFHAAALPDGDMRITAVINTGQQ